ncbi:MAG: PIN domain-containing protein [Candidatus Nanopelagicales bacterium]
MRSGSARAAGGPSGAARALLLSYGLALEPVTSEDAEMAARRRRRGSGLSLADRLCLALGERTGDDISTADSAWEDQDGVRLLQ